MKQTINKLLISGKDLANGPTSAVKQVIDDWGKRSGVKNVSSGCVRADADLKADFVVYSAHFDSSHWTGRGFKGFDKKNMGEPVTEFP